MAKPATKGASSKNTKSTKTSARTPPVNMRNKIRQATAPEPSTAPWDEPVTTPTTLNQIDEALNTLASLGIHPETTTPAPAPAPAPMAPVATTMPSSAPAPAPVASQGLSTNTPLSVDEHPLFKNMSRSTYQPTPAPAPVVGAPQFAYAGFNTPLGVVESRFQINKPADTPAPSKAFFASSSDPL